MTLLVGVIGIGNIGTSVCEGLLNGGYRVLVHDKFNRTLARASRRGLEWVEDPVVLAGALRGSPFVRVVLLVLL